MVKEKAVKTSKTAKAKATEILPLRPSQPISQSPTTRSNAATIRNAATILDLNEQRSFKMWISEIKQIQALLICKTGLFIQAKSACPQGVQESHFVKEFPKFYELFCKHPVLGSRVSKIPIIFLTVATSKATEVLNGEKLRKKYSAMKTYINNTLTPIYKRY